MIYNVSITLQVEGASPGSASQEDTQPLAGCHHNNALASCQPDEVQIQWKHWLVTLSSFCPRSLCVRVCVCFTIEKIIYLTPWCCERATKMKDPTKLYQWNGFKYLTDPFQKHRGKKIFLFP